MATRNPIPGISMTLLLSAACPACMSETAPPDETVQETEQALLPGDTSAWLYFDSTVVRQSFNSFSDLLRPSVVGADGVWQVGMTHGFGPLEGEGGNVQLTAVGSNARCKIDNWYEAGGFSTIDVRCFDGCKGATATGFMLSYANFTGGSTPSSSGAYATILVAADGSTRVEKEWGATVEPIRHGPGHYTVKLRGQPGALDSGVQVTPYGPGPAGHCKVGRWADDGAGNTDIPVWCYALSFGSLADSSFFLRYYRDTRDSRSGSGGFATSAADGSISRRYNVTNRSLPAGSASHPVVMSPLDWTKIIFYGQFPAQGIAHVTQVNYDAGSWGGGYDPASDVTYCNLAELTENAAQNFVAVRSKCWDPGGTPSAMKATINQVYLSPIH